MALLLPEGEPVSVRRPSARAVMAAWPLSRRLARLGERESLATHLVRYRFRGWNGAAAHPVADVEWAVEEVLRRYGDVAVSLVGTGMGARAALRAAGHPAVASVVALSPWLPDTSGETGEAGEPEPIRQLVDTQVLLAQGTDDRRTRPELTYRLADRLKKVNPRVCRFEVHTDGHGLANHRAEVVALAADFVLGTVCGRHFARPIADALAAPPPLGLRMPLASGFGRGMDD